MEMSLELILSLVSVGVAAGSLLVAIFVTVRHNKMMHGSSTHSLEKHLANLIEHSANIEPHLQAIDNSLIDHGTKINQAIRGVGFIRFHAFGHNDGGKQSFACAIINGNGDGIIISSLWARERMSFFAKEVKNFNPQQETTDEENAALNEARKQLA